MAYLRDEQVDLLIDATHPFAAEMRRNAVAACTALKLPLVAPTRPPWVAGPGDDWQTVPDIPAAVAALGAERRRVMLAIGRMHLAEFAAAPRHFYLLRLVDAPEAPPLPDCAVEVARGPFTLADDLALMKRHGIEVVVSKNSGGDGARAKLDAARELGLRVIPKD